MLLLFPPTHSSKFVFVLVLEYRMICSYVSFMKFPEKYIVVGRNLFS